MCCLCCARFSLTKKYYKERIDNAASYNSRLCSERKLRLPFLDSQTGVAQNHSNLWMLYRHRSPGKSDMVLQTWANAGVILLSRISESSTGYTFTPCVGYFISPGLDTR